MDALERPYEENYASSVRYFFSVIADRSVDVTATSEEMASIDAFNKLIESAGQRVMAAGIASPDQAKLFDNRMGLGQVLDRPAVDSDIHMAGFWIIEAEDDSVANRLAAQASCACNRMIEVRRFLS